MMIFMPLLVAIVPGILVILLAWLFAKKEFSRLVRMTPGVLTLIAAVVLFYIGFVNVRGFEGIAYGILSFFLVIFGFSAILVGTKKGEVGQWNSHK